MNWLKQWLSDIFDLHSDIASAEEIAERIESGALLKGPNMSILVLAMFIASIGLNMNSTAVIIGAMLISPLMGGIMAVGYGLATYDSSYVRKSFLRLLFQVLFCILASTIYFLLSPISNASSELLARTEPTIWDVLIACFGGLAGIIGLTRQEKSNVIPGVAIATALMPPLCTAGYGIASQSMKFFGGAVYLFFINCVFICLATLIVLKFIHIPAKHYVSAEILNRQKKLLLFITLATILPSLYLAYQSVQNNLTERQASQYIHTYIDATEDRQTVSYNLNTNLYTLEIALLGKPFSNEEIALLKTHLKEYNHLEEFTLKIIQNQVNPVDENTLEEFFHKKIEKPDSLMTKSSKDDLLKFQKLSSLYYPSFQQLKTNEKLISAISEKAKILFPNISSVAGTTFNKMDESGNIVSSQFMIIIYVNEKIPGERTIILKQWLEKELSSDVILNIQMQTPTPTQIISGNGINW